MNFSKLNLLIISVIYNFKIVRLLLTPFILLINLFSKFKNNLASLIEFISTN